MKNHTEYSSFYTERVRFPMYWKWKEFAREELQDRIAFSQGVTSYRNINN